MNVAITIAAVSPDAPPDTHFGRAAAFLLMDTDTGQRQVTANPAIGAPGGAGVQAAEFVIQHGAEAVISGSFGPKAYDVLAAAGVSMYRADAGTVDDLLRRYQNGELELLVGMDNATSKGRNRR
jgi:predicted Fe-Mo cluster-binding NifX family protein